MDIRLVGLALGTFAIGIEGFVVASLLPQIAGDTGVTLVQAGYLVVGSWRIFTRVPVTV